MGVDVLAAWLAASPATAATSPATAGVTSKCARSADCTSATAATSPDNVSPAGTTMLAQMPITDAMREDFEERAAIMEFDGGLSRDEAEREAWARVLKHC
ncbi:MAG: hypothetical protein P4L83_03685 [Nevskia sp.]|nr:hypothetical protein [Nevskia sp.]